MTDDRYWKSAKNCLVLKLKFYAETVIEEMLVISETNVKSLYF